MNEHLGEGTSAQVLVHSSMNMGKYGKYRMKQLTTGATTETVSSRHLLRVEYGQERITVIISQAKATGQTKTMSFLSVNFLQWTVTVYQTRAFKLSLDYSVSYL